MSQFEQLLAELKTVSDEQETLAKSLPAEDGKDDEAIQAAAADGDEDDGAEGDGAAANADGDKDDKGDGKEPMAKSMTAIVDGEEVEAIDATEMLKSLSGRIDAQESTLAKALEVTLSTIKSQGEMIKSLTAEVKKLAGQGKGRKTVLAISERPDPGTQTLAKSEPTQQPGEILAKALTAQKAGKITGGDVARCELAIQSGVSIPADVLARINN